MDRVVKLLLVAAIAFVAWKYGVPWIKEKTGRPAEITPTAAGGRSACVQRAERASETWGGGLRQFANPPYDLEAWARFRSNVESGIYDAETDCDCAGQSCEKARDAMRDLRALVNDLDSTIRNGSDASDFVQRQERIDNAINEAAQLAIDGK